MRRSAPSSVSPRGGACRLRPARPLRARRRPAQRRSAAHSFSARRIEPAARRLSGPPSKLRVSPVLRSRSGAGGRRRLGGVGDEGDVFARRRHQFGQFAAALADYRRDEMGMEGRSLFEAAAVNSCSRNSASAWTHWPAKSSSAEPARSWTSIRRAAASATSRFRPRSPRRRDRSRSGMSRLHSSRSWHLLRRAGRAMATPRAPVFGVDLRQGGTFRPLSRGRRANAECAPRARCRPRRSASRT